MTSTDTASRKLRVRDGFGIAAFVLVLAALVVGFLWVKGAWRAVIREAPDLIAEWPGGPWGFGVVAGALAVAGAYGGLWASDAPPGTETSRRVVRRTATAVCWAVPLLLTLYILSALPGRNCRSTSASCREIDGAFPALLTYAVTAAAAGWATYRVRANREEQRRAAQQARLRKLRKKGKGKSRGAR
ncbi:hypothetical protein [Streptomyces sp. NPDC048436]|uniref:hypothetical protein n=1 Tax=Streptomyces sp. NPDC048436 TaxID=3365550 RepID=UPI0037164307